MYVPWLELGLSHPLSPASVPPTPEPNGGGGGTRLRVGGWGSPNSDDWRKGLALCLLCEWGFHNVCKREDDLWKHPALAVVYRSLVSNIALSVICDAIQREERK